jgi:hypothetical protein
MSRRRALRDLSAALRGEPPADADWMAVLQLANAALVTPQIHAAALRAGALERLPAEVRTFTAEVYARNRERNRRLLDQLADAVGALNAAGIEPVLLKGAALWASLGRPDEFDRMLNDVDLLVRPDQAVPAIEALIAGGFGLANAYPGPEVHVVAELGRATDVGFIDLHQRPPGPPGVAELEDLQRHCRRTEWCGVRAWTPEPAVQAFFLVLHDQFHDGDYWRGGFSLRHLTDIAELSRGPEPLDWGLLHRLAKVRLVENALDAELIAAQRIAGADVPEPILRRRWARLQHARHMAQFTWPLLSLPLAGLGMLSEGVNFAAHKRADAAARLRLFGRPRGRDLAEVLGRLRDILGLAPGRI